MTRLEELRQERHDHGLKVRAVCWNMRGIPGHHFKNLDRERARIDSAIEVEEAAEAQREAMRRFVPR